MFFIKKNNLVDKSDALIGRNDPIENELFHEINGRNLIEIPNDFEIIILGMGCFWGAEKIFWQLDGVYHTSVGYAGGYTKNHQHSQQMYDKPHQFAKKFFQHPKNIPFQV